MEGDWLNQAQRVGSAHQLFSNSKKRKEYDITRYGGAGGEADNPYWREDHTGGLRECIVQGKEALQYRNRVISFYKYLSIKICIQW